MNSKACHHNLSLLLRSHLERIGRANDYLAGMRQAIADNDLARLQQLIAAPDFSVDEIEQLERQRHKVLADFGFAPDRAGFEQCLGWCDNDAGELSALYRRLIETLEQLQRSIQLNRLIVNRGKERVRRSIGILTGLGNAGSGKTYNSSGKAQDSSGPRDIAVV